MAYIFASKDLGVSITDPGVLRAVGGGALYLAAVVNAEDGDRWRAAVEATAGQTVLYDGEPILARPDSYLTKLLRSARRQHKVVIAGSLAVVVASVSFAGSISSAAAVVCARRQRGASRQLRLRRVSAARLPRPDQVPWLVALVRGEEVAPPDDELQLSWRPFDPRFNRPARELKQSIRQRPALAITKLPPTVQVEQGGDAATVARGAMKLMVGAELASAVTSAISRGAPAPCRSRPRRRAATRRRRSCCAPEDRSRSRRRRPR